MKREKVSEQNLKKLLDEKGSVGKVSAFLGIPYSTVYAWYKDYKIALPPSCMTIYDELRMTPFSEQQKSVVLGSVLGDGSLQKSKRAKNARLQIGHSDLQLDYLKWKKDLLAPFVSRLTRAEGPGPTIICGVKSYSNGYTLLNTIVHPDITNYYNRYCYYGKKVIHPGLVQELNPLALAVWLADDGSFSLRKECVYSLRGSIATDCFTYKEHLILRDALSKFFNGTITIGNVGTDQHRIYLSGTKAIDSLLDLITPILPSSIHYKLVPQRLSAKPLIQG